MAQQSDFTEVLTRLAAGSVEPSARWVRVKSGAELLANSTAPLLLIQMAPGVMHTYFFSRSEVAMDRLSAPVDRDGRRFWSVAANGRIIKDAAWTYIDPPAHLAALSDRLTFSWNSVQWYEEEEQVFVHARDPYHRVDVLASSRHVEVIYAGTTIADTHRPHLLFETWLPTRYYIPQEDVQMKFLQETAHRTACPYKGTARYWNIDVEDQVLGNGVWSYPNPIIENPKIKGLLCFFNEKVDIYVNGKLAPRPQTPWS